MAGASKCGESIVLTSLLFKIASSVCSMYPPQNQSQKNCCNDTTNLEFRLHVYPASYDENQIDRVKRN